MAKLSLTDISSGYAAPATINANNAAIEAALENTLSRDGTTPNSMSANLDMDSNRIVNLPAPVASTEPVRLVDVQDGSIDTSLFVVPSQTGHSGKALGTNGSAAAWRTIADLLGVTLSASANKFPYFTAADTMALADLPLSAALGGTGAANNAAATLTRSGNHALTLTTSGTTSLTLPTSGTVLSDAATITVAQGGTGRATSTTAYGLLAAGTTATGAHQTLAANSTSDTLVGRGPSALPVWKAIPVFRAERASSTQTLSNGVSTKLQFNSETIDTASCYDPTTNFRFTPNVAGYYRAHITGVYGGSSSRSYALIQKFFKNGSLYSSIEANQYMGTSLNTMTVHTSDLIYCNGSTDYIEAYAENYDQTSSGNTTLINLSGCSFSAELVRAD